MDYTDLSKLSNEELNKLAQRFNIDTKLKREDMIIQLEKASIENRVKLENEARAKLEVETRKKLEAEQKKLGIDKVDKTTPETIEIEKSKRVYVLFRNLESRRAERKFFWGDKYNFHLFPEKVHVLPLALIKHLETDCVMPVYGDVKSSDGQVQSVILSYEKRFSFERLGDAPVDAKFGVVLDDSILKQLKEVKYE